MCEGECLTSKFRILLVVINIGVSRCTVQKKGKVKSINLYSSAKSPNQNICCWIVSYAVLFHRGLSVRVRT
jgi:hypothetical protein